MTTPDRSILQHQLDEVRDNGLLDMLLTSADAHGLERAWVVGVGSRETNLKNMLGDFQGGEYHGVGILQRDIQHPEARAARDDGSWKTNPRAMIDADCAELKDNLARVLVEWGVSTVDDDALAVAAAGYNCGLSRALSAYDANDVDAHTTGHDYSADVMARRAVFKELLG